MQDDEDLCIELDFKAKKISFICRTKGCKHENVFDLSEWKEKQTSSPLPRIGIC